MQGDRIRLLKAFANHCNSINHPIVRILHSRFFASDVQAVATYLSTTGVTDLPTLQAATLHDVVEDTGTTLDEIRAEFGDEVANIVEVGPR